MKEQDLQYEKDNIGIDQRTGEEGIKCKNYELCQHILPQMWFNIKGYYICMNCDIFGWKELKFREGIEECIICNETGIKQVKFPTNCGHWFCVSCSRDILFWDETRYHLSPEPFGCPPCPNGCKNPIRGKQCYCYEYDDILDKWKEDNPEQFEEYNDAEHESIDLSETTQGSVYSSMKCPLCRKEYNRN